MKQSILLLMLITAVAVSFSFGQEKIEISTGPPPMAINFPVVREVGSAKVMSWAGRDQLISETGRFGTELSKDERINIKARFVTQGKAVVRPAAIDLYIYPESTERKYVDDRTFKITLDGKVFLSTTSKFLYANTNGHWIGAALKVEVPYRDFVTISEAKVVMFQVGPASFTLTDSAKQSLKDILKTVEAK